MTVFVAGTFVWFGLVSQFGKADDATALPIAFMAGVSAYVYTTAWLAVSYGFGLRDMKWPWTRRGPQR